MQRPSNSPRGTYDLLPQESSAWAFVEGFIKAELFKANFKEIRTPIFEATEIFERAAGETSDIVNKEMYTFEDRSGRSITLRPEGTAGVVRAYLSNGLDRTAKPVKLWYEGAMFRYERSQTGRYRQFTQLGVEVFGSASPEIEFETILLAWNCFKKLGLNDLQLEVNSVGDTSSREAYQEAMRQFLQIHESEICPDCQKRMQSNPLRALDCKVPVDQALYQANAPRIKDFLNESCLKHQERLFELLSEAQVKYTHNQALVRGLDYYTKTVFEIKTTDAKLGVQNTICAGGRYDNLIAEFGGPATPAFGWALGMERLMLLLKDKNDLNSLDFFVIYENGGFAEAHKFVQKLRNEDFSASLDYDGKPENKQFELGKKQGAQYAIFYNQNAPFSIRLKQLNASSMANFANSYTAETLENFFEHLAEYKKSTNLQKTHPELETRQYN